MGVLYVDCAVSCRCFLWRAEAHVLGGDDDGFLVVLRTMARSLGRKTGAAERCKPARYFRPPTPHKPRRYGSHEASDPLGLFSMQSAEGRDSSYHGCASAIRGLSSGAHTQRLARKPARSAPDVSSEASLVPTPQLGEQTKDLSEQCDRPALARRSHTTATSGHAQRARPPE